MRYSVLLFSAVAAVLPGCGVVFTTGRPDQPNDEQRTAITYYLPKDVLEVTVQIEERTKRVVEAGANDDEHPVLGSPQVSRKLGALTMTALTIADRSYPFVFDANSRGLYRNDTMVKVGDSGLLQSINTSTTGVAGSVVQNVLRIAGTALPFLDAPRAFSDIDAFTYDPAAPSLQGPRMHLEQLVLDDLSVSADEDPCDASNRLQTARQIREFSDVYFGGSLDFRFALSKVDDRRRLKEVFCRTFRDVTTRRDELEVTLRALAAAAAEEAISALTRKVRTQRSELDRAESAHAGARDALINATAAALVQAGAGTAVTAQTFKYVLDASQIVATPAFEEILEGQTASATEIERLIKGKPRAEELFERAVTLITFGAVDTVDPTSAPGKWAAETGTSCPDRGLRRACLFYREPVLHVLKIWTGTRDGTNYRFLPPEERVVSLITHTSPIRTLDLPTNAFSKRDTELVFTANGRLVSVRRESGAASQDATVAIQDGLRGLVTEYQTSLTAVQSIGQTEQAIRLQPLQEQISLAQRQLELIKAGTALSVGSSSQASIISTELATIERSLAVAQQQLLEAQNALSVELVAGAGLEQASLLAANELLAAQLVQLKNEIELIKLRRELEELRQEPAL